MTPFTNKNILIILFLCFSSFLTGEEILYHGSSTDGIERLEPRLRYTPEEELDSPAGIYATDLPAFAAGHSFPWSSDEGINLDIIEGIVIMEVPQSMLDRLECDIYIYTVSSELFTLVENESTGHTYRATQPVDCLDKMSFQNVKEAIEYYGGQVIILEDTIS